MLIWLCEMNRDWIEELVYERKFCESFNIIIINAFLSINKNPWKGFLAMRYDKQGLRIQNKWQITSRNRWKICNDNSSRSDSGICSYVLFEFTGTNNDTKKATITHWAGPEIWRSIYGTLRNFVPVDLKRSRAVVVVISTLNWETKTKEGSADWLQIYLAVSRLLNLPPQR